MSKSMIIKNIQVVDPLMNSIQKRDIYVCDGKIVDTVPTQNIDIIDGNNNYISPGFKDIHTHIFENTGFDYVNADTIGIKQGVTTVVDAGSTGINNYNEFKTNVIDKNKTHIKFFLNIAKKGLCNGLSELSDPTDLMTLDELLDFKKNHGENLVGLKVRMSGSVVKEQGLKPLIYGRNLSEKTGLPIMVHIGNSPPNLGDILNLLQKGDIVTHCFHGKKGGISDYPNEFINAADRGVHFDVGHGCASFSFVTVKKVLDIKNVDFSISTDLYSKNLDQPVHSLMDTMSKFLPMGYDILDLVRRVTVIPQNILGLGRSSMNIGDDADFTIFKVIEESKDFMDSEGYMIHSKKYLKPISTIINGERMWSCGL